MPGYLLNVGSLVTCAHQGQAKATVPLARVMIMNQPAVGQATPYAIAGCPYQLPTVPPTPMPCVVAPSWQKAATRVTAMGFAVLLADVKATCIPNGVPTNVVPAQSRVEGT